MLAAPKVSIILLSILFLFLMTTPLTQAPDGDETSPYLVVQTDKDAYYLGEFIVTNITLVNPTNEYYEYSFASTCHYDIFFYNLSDDLVYAPGFVCADILTSIDLDPYESYGVGQFIWNQTVPREEKVNERWVLIYDPVFSDGYRIVVKLRGYDISDEKVIEIVGPPPPPPPPESALRAEISAPAHVVSGDTVAIVVWAKDENAKPVEGANVSVDSSLGKLTPASGMTDASGRFLTSFEPPEVEGNNSEAVFILITGLTKEGYIADYWSYAIVRVYPAHTKVLSLDIFSFGGDFVEEGDQTVFLIEVKDGRQSPISDVAFNISSDPEHLQLEVLPTEEIGKYYLQINTSSVQSDVTFLIQIDASKSGYFPGYEAFEIVVLNIEEDRNGISELLLYTLGISVAAFACGVLIGHLVASRKRKK